MARSRYKFTKADRERAARSLRMARAKRAAIRAGRAADRAAERLADIATAVTGVPHYANAPSGDLPRPFLTFHSIDAATPIGYADVERVMRAASTDREMRKWLKQLDTMVGAATFDPNLGRFVGREGESVQLGFAGPWDVTASHAEFEAGELGRRYGDSQVHALTLHTL